MKIVYLLSCALLCFFAGNGQNKVTDSDLQAAAKIMGLHFTLAERDSMRSRVNSRLRLYNRMHAAPLENSVPFSLTFDPLLPGMQVDKVQKPVTFSIPQDVSLPAHRADLAFYSVPQLASLLRNKKITSVELTRFFINRLKKYGDTIHCVVSLMEDSAMKQAAQADREMAAGHYRGLLQGIPYGIKDLFAVKGTKTTWGAMPYRNQVIDEDSYVYTKLKEAGAVLIAKLTTGALAMDDYWFGGRTRNPWKLTEGSSGSSAGPASATVAGLVPFAIGTETYGSIISPSTVCGATGLRPTFGSISRYGAMALAWSLDKVGPLCRSAHDAAIVFYYLHGTDGNDASAVNMPFNFSENRDISNLKIGYAVNYFQGKDTLGNENQVLGIFKKAGINLIPVVLPDSALYPFGLIGLVISSESAAAFDEFTRSGKDDQMLRQGKGEWPNTFRAGRFIPATAYINAQRYRYQLMQKMNKIMETVDVLICPTWAGSQAAITNLTGQPAISLPTGFNKAGTPTGITFLSNLYDEATLLEVAQWYQQATPWNKEHPSLFRD